MAEHPVTMARRHVFGDMNFRCDPVTKVPVYLDDIAGEKLGFVIESSNEFADAIIFHLADDVCKKVATGYFSYSCEYSYAGRNTAANASQRRLKLTSITLIARQNYEKPIPRRHVSEPTAPTEE